MCQIICNRSNRVQILRSISSRWRFKCPRGSTVTNALIKVAYAMVEKITVSEFFYKKIKRGFHHSAQILVTSLCLIICVVNRWGGEGVGGSTQAPANAPIGPNDLDANERAATGHLHTNCNHQNRWHTSTHLVVIKIGLLCTNTECQKLKTPSKLRCRWTYLFLLFYC